MLALRLGYVPQIETVDWSFPVTVRQVVLMAKLDRVWPWPSRAERNQADQLLDRLGVGGLADRHIRELSGRPAATGLPGQGHAGGP